MGSITFLQKVLKALGSRTARNIYFWAFILLIKMTDVEELTAYPKAFYYAVMVFLLAFFLVLIYFNSFFLVPRYLAKKRWLLYFLLASGFVTLIALLYTFTLKALQVQFTQLEVPTVSIITMPVTSDLSFASILTELPTFLITMAILQVIFTFLWFSNEAIRKARLLDEILGKQKETELAFLKSQINPHFLFNTLNNLYSLALKKSDEGPEVILKLSAILRYVLYEANVESVPFEKEKEIMQAYIDVEMLRLSDTDDIHFSILSDQARSIPPLIWLPLLENLFKHGRVTDKPMMDFRFHLMKNTLTITTKNTFSDRKPTETAGGIGLGNLRKRLELLYPSRHSIETSTEGNIFTAVLKLSLQ